MVILCAHDLTPKLSGFLKCTTSIDTFFPLGVSGRLGPQSACYQNMVLMLVGANKGGSWGQCRILIMTPCKGIIVDNDMSIFVQYLVAKILLIAQRKNDRPLEKCKSPPQNVRWPPVSTGNIMDLSHPPNALRNLWRG
jgi:hypothetical protein